ncbi:MAG TPA: hypothetical protein VKU40_11190 [Thermoanaerobaculia bacterium]|nr:hypothetical protein [Thermoanaerobaculia bacterium]
MPEEKTAEEHERRITNLEVTLKGLKFAATALGITGAVLLAFVLYTWNLADDAQKAAEQAHGSADEASERLATETDEHLGTLDTRSGEIHTALAGLFTQDCQHSNGVSCGSGGWVTCPNGYYVKRIWVDGRGSSGRDGCVNHAECCRVAVEEPASTPAGG